MTAATAPSSRGGPVVERTRHVVQGEYAVSGEPGVVLTTILGSCVAACMRDPVAGVGGMNHFLLPGDEGDSRGDSMKYGVNAMELLINALLKMGAQRRRLEAKLFGGANVVHNLSDVGKKNAAFALKFLQAEGIVCVGQSLGGDQARRLRYWPETGRAAQLLLAPSQSDIFATERKRVSMPAATPAAVPAGDLELF
ncbi:MAG: chemotaxis protein CheD [Alphaproteobacteria bacterium]|jgi:chemotaxis protein CheD